MRIEQLAEDVEVFVGDTYHSNAIIFRAKEGALLVDALASRADARALVAHAGPVRMIVLTHGFSDHLAALGELPGEPAVRIAHPTEIRWGRHSLVLVPLPAHTESDLVVDVPGLDTLLVGDVAV